MSKFKTDNGLYYISSLFLEKTYHDTSVVLFTLKDHDHRGYLSLYRLYIEMEDLTEYEFANKYLDGWKHWELLSGADWFQPFILRWRKELELKIKARALRAVMEESASGGKNAYLANKYLIEKGWVERPTGKRGRPSNKEILEETFKTEDIQSDFERINLQ